MEEVSQKNIFHSESDKWLIDTDYSYDDQLALYFLLKKNKLNVIAITLTHRSPKININFVKQKLESDLLKMNKESIKVFIGADRPYVDYVNDLKDDEIIDPYNYKHLKSENVKLKVKEINKDSILINQSLKSEDEKEIVAQNISPTDYLSNIAAVKIVEIVKLHGKCLNILCLGPLTNISLAIILDTSIKNLFNKLYIVGGSVYNFGNSGNSSEYNFRCDPVAAKNVIMNYQNIHLLSYEIDLLLRENRKELLLFLDDIRDKIDINKNWENDINFFDIKEFIHNFKEIYEKEEENDDFYHSLFGFTASVLIMYPELILKKNIKVLPCDVDIFGRKTRGGLMIQNYEHLKNGKFNDIAIINDYDFNEYLKVLKKLLQDN